MTLTRILGTMDVPQQRKSDTLWLLRNLAVRNRNHPQFAEAVEMLRRRIAARP